ncbi:protein ZBED8-like [Daktulosphaira vitifoliae]|uniref:protein ZBED8-like n=1 Tax=Daktulosphaira vitifoliae TaxID=58002 RepID=UPI0021AA4BE2|nr:protein ZBED8-like [Daktulosphaira vitifoliae]
MEEVIKILNFIRAKSSLKHHQFKSFLDEFKSEYGDLQLYNNVRWLRKGFVLQRFFTILDEVKLFLSSRDQLCAKGYVDYLDEKEHIVSTAFLTDIFKHINDLISNYKVKGN